MRIAFPVALLVAGLAVSACSKEPEAPAAAPPAQADNWPKISYSEMEPTPKYPLKTCVVDGKELPATGRYVIAYKGYEVQFCNKECIRQFATDPEGYVRKVNPKAMFDAPK